MRALVRLLVLASLTLVALVPAAHGKLYQPIAFRQISVDHGLSQNTVMSVLQDSRGFIWLATENGLDRYDGYSITNYQRGRIANGELGNDYVWDIVEDPTADLWIATEAGGVVRWVRDMDRFQNYQHHPDDPHSIGSNHTRALLLARDRVFIGTLDSGLSILDRVSGRAVHLRHDPDDPTTLPSDSIYTLLEDSRGNIWVGTEGGLAKLPPNSTHFERFVHDPEESTTLGSDWVVSLMEDSAGTLWVGTLGGGVSVLWPDGRSFEHFRHDDSDPRSISDDNVRALLEDDMGRIWIGTAQGLNRFHPETASFSRYMAQDRRGYLADDYIMSLTQDRGGVLWVGTRSSGVHTWNSLSWEMGHYQAPWLEGQSVTGFATDNTGYWIGTLGGGLTHVNEATGETLHYTKSGKSTARLNDDRVMSLLITRDGTLWVGTMGGGVSRLEPGAQEFEAIRHDPDNPRSLGSDGIMSLFEDSRGRVWIGTYGGGATAHLPASGAFLRYPPKVGGMCGNQGRGFAEDSNGTVWIATDNGLCFLNERAATFHTYRHDENDENSLPVNQLHSIHVDNDDHIWIGTSGGGLVRVIGSSRDPDSIRFERITRSEGLSSNLIYGILADDTNLWVSTNNGLSRYNTDTGDVRNFSVSHGLQGAEFHFGAHHKGIDGRLFFGGANGFNAFSPSDLTPASKAPQVVLTGIEKMNKRIEPGMPWTAIEDVQVSYRESVLTFEFAALDFTEPAGNRYAYMLEGFDPQWNEAGNHRRLTYTNLDAGTYRFLVKAAASGGTWNEDGLELGVSVEPAPWATPIAQAAYLALAIGIVIIYGRRQFQRTREHELRAQELESEVRKRTMALAESNEELQRAYEAKGEFLARMSHEIRSPMNGVLGMAELLARTTLSTKQRKFTDTIRRSGESLLHIINDILDYSKLESRKMQLDPIDTDLEPVLNDIADLFAVQSQAKGVDFVCVCPPTGFPSLRVDGMRLRQVLVNLVANAVKFTEHGHVTLSATTGPVVDDCIEVGFSVADTGIGIAEDSQDLIFDSFAQEDGSTTRRYGGTGLGLWISKQLVELMGGHLRLASKQGMGSNFSFRLRLPLAETMDTPASAPAFEGRALVAVGNDPLWRQIDSLLGTCGIESTRMRRKELKAGRLLTDKPDLVIIDLATASEAPGEIRAAVESGLAACACVVLVPFGQALPDALPSGVTEVAAPLKRQEAFEAFAGGLGKQFTAAQTEQEKVVLKGTVLLVEDNQINQEVFTGMLHDLGCAVLVAPDGQTAVNLATREPIDVILMDYQLPDINGPDATRLIRGLPTDARSTPIVALTANASHQERKDCLEAGMDDFLAKPCPMSTLAIALSRWLPLTKIPAPEAPEIHQVANEEDDAPRSDFDETALARIRGLKRPDGTDMLGHVVELFHRTSAPMTEAMQAAFDAGDVDALRFSAHKLKSGCANVGAQTMAQTCREIEDLCRAGQIERVEKLLFTLRRQHQFALSWLEDQLDEAS